MSENPEHTPSVENLMEIMLKMQTELVSMRRGNTESSNIDEQSGGNPGAVGLVNGAGAENAVRVINSGIRAESLKVHRFDGTDYDLWAFLMLRNLKIAHLWDVVEKGWTTPGNQNSGVSPGGELDESVDIINGSGPTAEWLMRNTEAEGLILQSLAKNQLATLTACGSAKEMWEKLSSNYAEKSRANRMMAERDYLNCTMRRGQNMEDYIRTFDLLSTRLRALGQPLEEESQVNRLLEGLSPDYEVIRTTLQDRDDLTYDQACARLLANARMRPRVVFPPRPRVNHVRANPGDGEAVGGNAAAAKPKKARKGSCYICGDPKHFSNKCPYNTGDSKKKICHTCKKEGHLKANCPDGAEGVERGAFAETRNVRPWAAVAIVQEEQSAHSVNLKGEQKSCWIIDSGATHHMSNNLNWFTKVEDLKVSKWLTLADASTVKVNREGEVELEIPEKTWTTVLKLGEVLYVPELDKNLFSVSHALKEGIDIRFDANQMECRLTKAGELVAIAKWRANLWMLERARFKEPGQELEKGGRPTAASISNVGNVNLWHHRMGHLGEENLLKLAKNNMVRRIPEKLTGETVKNNCVGCAQGKQQKLSFGERKDTTNDVLEIIHTDLMGPFTPLSMGGKRYVLVIVDDYSRCTFVVLLASKDEAHYQLKTWITYAERETGKSVKLLRSDNGGEFTSKEFEEELREMGIVHQLTLPYTPQHNGVVERANRVLMECARSMLFAAQLSKGFWGEAVVTACYLKNRSPHKGLMKANLEVTPYQAWSGKHPSVNHLRVFGCRASVLIPEINRGKLDPKSWTGIMVGYAQYRGYRIWDPIKRRIVESRNVMFDENLNKTGRPILTRDYLEYDEEELGGELQENASPDWMESTVNLWHPGGTENENSRVEFQPTVVEEALEENISKEPYEQEAESMDQQEVELEDNGSLQERENVDSPEHQSSEHVGDLEEIIDEEVQAGEPSDLEMDGPRKSSRIIKKARVFTYSRRGEPSMDEFSGATTLSSIPVPGSFKEAMSGPNINDWKQAVQGEMESLIKNKTWNLMKLPAGRRALRNKWVFALKEKEDGSVRFKGRLVINGNMQVEGVEYGETYAPVIKLQSLRILLSIANQEKMEVHQMDVKTAFLHGILEEEIYMRQPEGQMTSGKENLICKLNRSLYGLRQSPRCWNILLDQFLIGKLKFRRCLADKATYIRGLENRKIYVGVYVDDLLIISKNDEEIQQVKEVLSARFEMVDFGRVSTVLSIKIKHDLKRGVLTMSQEKYIQFLLIKFGMEDCKPTLTPMVSGLKLSKSMEPNSEGEIKEMEKFPYRSAVGSLMYLMTSTRPDIASAIGIVSRFLQNPGKLHWEAVKRIFRYLQQTKSLGLKYVRGEKLRLEGYTDADWGGCVDTRRSTGAYVFKLGGAVVSWASKRQNSVSLSTCEAEYMAACSAAKEAVWMNEMMIQLGFPRSETVQIKTDSQSALNLIKNPVLHSKTKHIGIQYHFVRELADKGEITFTYCPTELMIADSLTKAVPREKVEFCRSQMGVECT